MTDPQTDLRDRIAAAMRDHGMPHLAQKMPDDEYDCCADAVLAVLPPPADRADVLHDEAALIRAHCPDHLDSNSADGSWISCHCDVADDMERRLAAEAQQECPAVDTAEDRCAECGHFRGAHEEGQDPVSPGRCTVCADDDAWHNFEPTEEVRRLAAEAQQPEPVVTVHAAPDLSPAAKEALGALIDVAKEQAACDFPHPHPEHPCGTRTDEAHRLALSEALHLGSGAPWDAIRDRASELSRRDVEARQPETETRAVRWRLQILDGVWGSYGRPFNDRDEAIARYRHDSEQWPTWNDPDRTPVQRRIVRETTTYIVEQPTAADTGEEADA